MTKIASYVFFDLETTGLPHLERNKTKITELCFVAVLRSDLENTSNRIKIASKLVLLFNPKKRMQKRAAEITGLSNKLLQNEPIFREKTDTILTFLNELPKPVCLVAHNGDIFDYKILLTEFSDISMNLPADLLCVDSLKAFKSILNNDNHQNILNSSKQTNDSLTDDDWSELEISAEDWASFDSLCSTDSEMLNAKPSIPLKQENKSYKKKESKFKIEDYTLQTLYRRLLNKDVVNAHRAEGDCMMLLQCVAEVKDFLQWADDNCRHLHAIEPLDRTKYEKKLSVAIM